MNSKKYQLQLETSLPKIPEMLVKIGLQKSLTKAHCNKYLQKVIKRLNKEQHLQPSLRGGFINLTIVDDKEIQVINKAYRDIDKPTDVVSLSYFEEKPFPGHDLVGEIFISLDTAIRQAQEHHKTVMEELEFLFIHGVLHIFGYDHEEPQERKIMFDLQDEILETASWRPLIDY